uniref:Coiled-coil domain containing 30 n=1 Tax=Oryctolagus cuniculus TaxID=9986 RepID=G1TKT9_RABIT
VSSARRCCALGRGYGPLCGQTGRAGPPGGVGHVRRHQGPVGSAASPLFGQLQQRRRGALARLLLRATGSCSCTPLPPLPFAHRFPPQTWLAALRPSGPAHSGLLSLEAEENALPGFAAALQSYQEAAAAGTFLAVEFTTLADYLHLLQAAAQALNPLGSSAMFYLAAAVSDFYVPVSEMPEHKIQSSAGALQITMKMVPKMLSPLVKDWAPKAFIISFKLETDPSIVINRARNALEVYRHQVVVANILESLQSFVVIVTKDSETKLFLSEEEVEKGIAIEEKIVDNLQARHTAFLNDKN